MSRDGKASCTQESDVARLSWLAVQMDNWYQIPGTRIRFGLDSLFGLIPGIGDAATAFASAFIIYKAHRIGVSKPTLARMSWNAIVDFAVGTVPVFGDVFDLFWRANSRNVALIERDLNRPDKQHV